MRRSLGYDMNDNKAARIRVSVTIGAKKEKIGIGKGNVLEIAVKEKAERNMANVRVKEIVAGYAGVPLSAVQIETGRRSPKKTLLIIR